jgi:hypothetical protein
MGNISQCETCGKNDDHPKAHVLVADPVQGLVAKTFHHDCIPFAIKEQLLANEDPHINKVIEACEGGLKGDKLREAIQDKLGAKAEAE